MTRRRMANREVALDGDGDIVPIRPVRDARLLSQVLRSLAGNARKFTACNEPARIDIGHRPANGSPCMTRRLNLSQAYYAGNFASGNFFCVHATAMPHKAHARFPLETSAPCFYLPFTYSEHRFFPTPNELQQRRACGKVG
jgi:hypothetical protein